MLLSDYLLILEILSAVCPPIILVPIRDLLTFYKLFVYIVFFALSENMLLFVDVLDYLFSPILELIFEVLV